MVTLSIHQLRCMPPPQKGRPRGGLGTKNFKKLPSRCVSYEAGGSVYGIHYDFMVPVMNRINSCLVLRVVFY